MSKFNYNINFNHNRKKTVPNRMLKINVFKKTLKLSHLNFDNDFCN